MGRGELFFEQAVECGARVGGIARGLHGVVVAVLDDGGGQSVTGDGHARGKQLAGIGLILDGDAGSDGLDALEARGGIKVGALLAAVKGGAAFGAVALEVYVARQGDRATKTSGGNYVLHQARKLRPRDIGGRPGAGLPRPLGAVGFRPAVRVLIAVLPVFAISVHMSLIDSLLESSGVRPQRER